jgi:Na+-translocating ferredoxin:NAD+ oxidoreductase RNF subunit RnfB
MLPSSLLIPFWMAVPVVGQCYFPSCDPSLCASTPVGSGVQAQGAHLTTCLTGPAEEVESLSSCADLDADDHVTLRDFAAFQASPVLVCSRELTVEQTPGLGFCPVPGTIHRANLIPTVDDRLLLAGSILVEGDPAQGMCLWYEAPAPSDCFFAVPFPPRTLTPDQEAQLSALLAHVTSCQNPDFAVDPCRILCLRYDGASHSDYCYDGPKEDAYRQAIHNVTDYLDELVHQP